MSDAPGARKNLPRRQKRQQSPENRRRKLRLPLHKVILVAPESCAGVMVDVVLDERHPVRHPQALQPRLQQRVAREVVCRPCRAGSDTPARHTRCAPCRDTAGRHSAENHRFPAALRNRGNADPARRRSPLGKENPSPAPATLRSRLPARLRVRGSRTQFRSPRSGPQQGRCVTARRATSGNTPSHAQAARLEHCARNPQTPAS